MTRRAMTLVELLISITILGMLIGLLLPALRGVRDGAHQAVTLSNLRGAGVSLTMFTLENRDRYPFRRPDEPMATTPPGMGEGIIITSDPWALRYSWPTQLHKIAPWAEHYDTWLHPEVERDRGQPWRLTRGDVVSIVWPTLEMSSALMARPFVWGVKGTLTNPEAALAPTSTNELSDPSAKAILFDTFDSVPNHDRHVARGVLAADGSSAVRWDDRAVRPWQNQLEPWIPARLYHDTPQGVHGRDF